MTTSSNTANNTNLEQIPIDFQGGAHGNYLEFVCNKFLTDCVVNTSPFNDNGASHSKGYCIRDQKFRAGHYSDWRGERNVPLSGKIISIRVAHEDLLPLTAISLLRAGDYGYDNDYLEENTFHKLSVTDYAWVLDNIVSSFFKDQIRDSYNAVKDPSWPDVETSDDFQKLPDWIKKECLEVHNLKLLELNEDNPNCPRYILREFFKLGFLRPEQSGFIARQKDMMWYYDDNDVYNFPYASFYDIDLFVKQINKIAKWTDTTINDLDSLIALHREFLTRQVYKDSKIKCDELLERIFNKESFKLPAITLLEESYVLAEIERKYGKHIDIVNWFQTSDEIHKLLA
jgi:hypothetical protein